MLIAPPGRKQTQSCVRCRRGPTNERIDRSTDSAGNAGRTGRSLPAFGYRLLDNTVRNRIIFAEAPGVVGGVSSSSSHAGPTAILTTGKRRYARTAMRSLSHLRSAGISAQAARPAVAATVRLCSPQFRRLPSACDARLRVARSSFVENQAENAFCASTRYLLLHLQGAGHIGLCRPAG